MTETRHREFNEWYGGEYIPKLMREVPHFTHVRRYEGSIDGEKIFITEYETTDDTIDQAFAEMRSPDRADANAGFYRWKDKAITLHDSVRLFERMSMPSPT